MNPVPISIEETSGIYRVDEMVRVSIPFPNNTLFDFKNLSLKSHTQNTNPCQFKILAHWPNGSIRWLEVRFLVRILAKQTLNFEILEEKQHLQSPENIKVTITPDTSDLQITTANYSHVINTKSLHWQTKQNDTTLSTAAFQLTDKTGKPCKAELNSDWEIIESGQICTTISAKGTWFEQVDKAEPKPLVNFNCTLRFLNNSPTIESHITIHNPKRARHIGGLWDLGDPGSIHFKSLNLVIKNRQNSQHINTELNIAQNEEPVSSNENESISIYQDSSGGENWNSANHVNAEGKLTTQFKGYKIDIAGNTFAKGNRAQPIIKQQFENHTVQACIHNFWQNFPSALGADKQSLSVDMFPSEVIEIYELQGGEQKTHTCFVSYSDKPEALDWTRSPLTPTISSKQYETANAFPWFVYNSDKTQLDTLIAQGLDGKNNFYNKREQIDEFGWRNFGDIFADHETLYQKEDEPTFISHYNNQYDAVYGFARQYALRGDPRWFELMDDLALHISDIDIYNTNEDRAEYNHGLFWHTDHYLDASTATHRTYTKNSTTSSIPGQTGGGPAAEHCYSTGLLFHYYLTGNETSRQAALGLANWMVANHEGNGGLLEQILAIKKHDLPKLKALLRGESPSSHRYPFTRGTGNYLNSMLDAWQLTNDESWKTRIEAVIRATIHPADNIEQRDLLNAEVSWSYLILLTSITKYLLMKQEADELDDNYQYALMSFIHYAKWIAKHEQPFLKQAEQLEFPNDTWTAQDIRKAMLMFQAAYFDPEFAETYLNKANEWLDYVTNKLESSPEAHYARILIVLMQNYGPHQLSLKVTDKHNFDGVCKIFTKAPKSTWLNLLKSILTKLFFGIVTFRPKSEKEWLKKRLES